MAHGIGLNAVTLSRWQTDRKSIGTCRTHAQWRVCDFISFRRRIYPVDL